MNAATAAESSSLATQSVLRELRSTAAVRKRAHALLVSAHALDYPQPSRSATMPPSLLLPRWSPGHARSLRRWADPVSQPLASL